MKLFISEYRKPLIAIILSIAAAAVLCTFLFQKVPEEKEPVTIVCYGDSNTWADNPVDYSRYPYSVRWTTILSKELGDDYLVIPAGLNGRTTAFDTKDEAYENGLTELPYVLASNRPVDMIIFFLGTNDTQIAQNKSVQEITRGMKTLIQCARDTTTQLQGYEPVILVVSPPRIDEAVLNTWLSSMYDETSIEKTTRLEQAYADLCKKENCIFISGTDTLEVSKEDGIHLSQQGHYQLGILLADTIKQMKGISK